jgi:hypothetical protein
MPSILCTKPTCPAAGAVVQLAGSCESSNPDAQLVYTLADDVTVVTNITCPSNGSTVVVKVKPVIPTLPECPYDGKTAYTFNSAHPGAGALQGQGLQERGRGASRAGPPASLHPHACLPAPSSLPPCPLPPSARHQPVPADA